MFIFFKSQTPQEKLTSDAFNCKCSQQMLICLILLFIILFGKITTVEIINVFPQSGLHGAATCLLHKTQMMKFFFISDTYTYSCYYESSNL